jgi:hypothetical protein
MPEDQAPKSPESSVEIIYPTAQRSPLSEFSPEIKELLRNNPEAKERFLFMVLDGIKADQELRRDYQRQEFELKTIRESRITKESIAKKNNTRLIIGVIALAFSGSLGYGFLHKDTGLADKVFTGAMGLLGGTGIVALNRKKDNDDEK